jgi:beta-N-acetylhexosaminidase
VQRLKERDGFIPTSSAQQIAKLEAKEAKKQYDVLAQQLQHLGINTNFAPVVDLAINKDNVVIYKLQRSYAKDVLDVVAYAQIFIDALHEHDVLAVLKHFPGHGSSLKDSHQGFVDVSHTWNKIELEPYKKLIQDSNVEMIMTAHVFNQHLDKRYPATLSYATNTALLRQELGYKGVIISDDLQMDAILKHYSLEQTVTLAINSGVDLLLFGNQLAQTDVQTIIDTIYAQVLNKQIAYTQIQKANHRIKQLQEHIKK